MRYIEVIATVRVERTIEAYETTLELTTVAGRKVTCVDEANQLREAILCLLRQSGLSELDITEGGGEANQNYWSSSKSVVHRVLIRNKDMAVLMIAMAATERHFAAIRRQWFGGIKQNFTFLAPTPIYAANATADESLREALRNARRTAEIIASETGCRLGNLVSVAESSNAPRPNASGTQPIDDPEGTTVDFCLSEADSIGAISYNGLPQSVSRATRRYHVRFAMEDAEQSHAPKPPTVLS